MKQQKRSSHWFSEKIFATALNNWSLNLTAKQLVFVDELLFNEITDWRLRAYALIDQSARYRANIIRCRLWSVLFAYTSNDKFFVSLSNLYLFCQNDRNRNFKRQNVFELFLRLTFLFRWLMITVNWFDLICRLFFLHRH